MLNYYSIEFITVEIDKIITIVTGVIKDDWGNILLLKRSGTKTFQGFWQLPEGKLEKQEQPQNALRREIKEELNVKIKNLELTKIKPSALEAQGVRYLALRIVFNVTLEKNIITLSEEHSEYKWVKPEYASLLSLLPGTLEVISTEK